MSCPIHLSRCKSILLFSPAFLPLIKCAQALTFARVNRLAIQSAYPHRLQRRRHERRALLDPFKPVRPVEQAQATEGGQRALFGIQVMDAAPGFTIQIITETLGLVKWRGL